MTEKESLRIDDYKTVRDAVFERLRKAILNGYFKPGERLVESQIAEEMGVSRTPVREAIRRLEIEKLVVNLPRKGVMVAPINESQVKEIFNIRGALEGLAVKLAIDNIDSKTLRQMEEILQEMDQAIKKGDLDKEVECNTRFHDCILNASKSPKLSELLRNIHDQIQRFRHKSLSVEGRPQIALSEHNDILQAIKEKDKSKAEQLIKNHIENAGKALLKKIHEEDSIKVLSQ
ncbi:MAG TPA: GntR family transcriptional regulator [Thermoanaerobacterales bacterium]|nr:GntR family transcriptional regulator [Thermoanaerobacterales bacterium]